ncbi:hypothetical protein DRO61_11735 [Candidatus Bathyarchaeota archaeon]|nr:MAG: hypothetical protein DRO61_11735 [Candidatus Bathyarchaeota archaeon]
MLKRKKIRTRNEYTGGYSDISSNWLRADNSTGFFDDLLNKPEGSLVVWSMHEDKLYSYDTALKWVRENKR